jgi:nucleoside-diphosphate-sugar epimerase
VTSCDPATIFLTGSSGLVGRSLLARLTHDDDFRLVPVGRGASVAEAASSRDIVVHAAWPSIDAGSWGPFRDWSLSLRRTAAERGAWFVTFGSGVEAYPDKLKEPYLTYAERKLELKAALAEVDKRNAAWLRLHYMFGPGEQPSRLIPAAVRAGLANEIFVCGSLDRRRRWLHLDDQADYLAEFFKAPRPGEWDIAGSHDVSFRDLLGLVGCAIGRDLQLREIDVAAPDAVLSVIAPERMASVVPENAGNRASLLGRLKEYAAQLAVTSTGGSARLS